MKHGTSRKSKNWNKVDSRLPDNLIEKLNVFDSYQTKHVTKRRRVSRAKILMLCAVRSLEAVIADQMAAHAARQNRTVATA